jgi:hypothetical protein
VPSFNWHTVVRIVSWTYLEEQNHEG